MKKQLVVVGMVILLIVVGFSGCFESDKTNNIENDASKFIGLWENGVNGTVPNYVTYTFYANGSLKTTTIGCYKLIYQNEEWFDYSIKNGQLCTTFKSTSGNYTYYYEFQNDSKVLKLKSGVKNDEFESYHNIQFLYRADFDGYRKPPTEITDYWINAFTWLNEQDKDIGNTPEKPSFMSWYSSWYSIPVVGNHPNIANNFTDAIPPTGNFFTSTSEEEAVAILIAHLIITSSEGNNNMLTNEIYLVLNKYISYENARKVKGWIEDPSSSPSYAMPIGSEFDKNLSLVFHVDKKNALYHDISSLIVNNLDDESITWLYHDIQDAAGNSIRYFGFEGYDKKTFFTIAFYIDKSLIAKGALEDDFMQIKSIDASEKKLTNDDLLGQLFYDESEQSPIENTELYYKDAYFDTMFYRTYLGPASGTSGDKQEFSYQLPCIDMKHFCAEFISNYSQYPYYSGKSAVVIAKYYEGAYINGSVTFMGEPISAQIVVQKKIYEYGTSIPIDHDKTTTNDEGAFNLIAPTGDITLQIRRNVELGENAFVIKNVTFDSNTNPELFLISDDEAMRKEGTNYERIINIATDPASIEGYVYVDTDNNSIYNASIDETLSNVNITLYEIEEFDPQTGLINSIGSIHELTTDNNGYYNVSNLMPGYYSITASLDDIVIHENYLSIHSGNNSYNIPKLKSTT